MVRLLLKRGLVIVDINQTNPERGSGRQLKSPASRHDMHDHLAIVGILVVERLCAGDFDLDGRFARGRRGEHLEHVVGILHGHQLKAELAVDSAVAVRDHHIQARDCFANVCFLSMKSQSHYFVRLIG